MVDLRFLPKHFGSVVGTYEGFLLLCECRWGGDHTCRWWGHLTTICCQVVKVSPGGSLPGGGAEASLPGGWGGGEASLPGCNGG